ncbi:Ig-like domain-containing protein [Actinocrispum wychmicini]|uniref:Putative surface cell wall-binding protein n=1 Tax=Actinocrispum wychmicini TaxID=1213861 RepID=A0A4R2JS67_9PSEU|nr:Ig-like domain-containing protein [Actinocrispum wychmicini]TCO62424.1 putative surface cell wall-binding protein [Actinocrispum wychmicini]
MRIANVLRRLGAGTLVFGAATAATLAFAGTASAGTLGTLNITPATGQDTTAPSVKTSAACPADADAYYAKVFGPGGFAPGLIATPTTDVNLSHTAGFPAQLGLSFKDIAVDNSTTVQPGKYTIEVSCIDAFAQTVKGTFDTSIWFTSTTAYQNTDPNAPVTTATALAVAPASPVTQGTNVTLTATVTPASATGTVQFKDGAGNLGSPVNVAGGTASLATTALPTGTRSLTAVFTGSAPNISGSTSPAVSYVVNAPVATPTTTALSVTPSGSVAQFTNVTLNATVAPAGAAGAVQFTDNGANLGSPAALTAGSATLSTSNLGVGAHNFTAKFVPANAALFAPSESAQVPLTVSPFTGITASEKISTTVLAGELLISVENENVTLPSPVMLPDGSKLTTAGALNPVRVTDTRAGNPGWNVSGQVADFGDGQSHSINGANLGWTPKVIDKVTAQTITAGPAVTAGNALAPGAAAPAGVGLSSARTLATATALAGNGTAHLGADLALNVPTATVAGTYTAVLTLTAI